MKKLIIGMLGCGNVGGGVWNLLHNFQKELALSLFGRAGSGCIRCRFIDW